MTDASGKHLLKIDFESVKPPRPYTITAAASVQDVNRQTWSSSTSLLVHPSSLYVGIKTPRTFVQKGEKIDVESIVSDIDGNLSPAAMSRSKPFSRIGSSTRERGQRSHSRRANVHCQVGRQGRSKCTFVAKQGGTIHDHRDRDGRPRAVQRERVDRLGSGRQDAAETQCRAGRGSDHSDEKGLCTRAMSPSCS